LTENPTVEWAGSTVQVPVGTSVVLVLEIMLLLRFQEEVLAHATIAPGTACAHGRSVHVHVLI
jgi:hypothetical protein